MKGLTVMILLALIGCGCASIAPKDRRFVVMYDQRTGLCRMQIVRDTRSPVCFAMFKCGHDDAVFVAIESAACVP